MQISATAREGRLLVESAIDTLKDKQDQVAGAKFNLSFQLVIAPGLKNDSETLSYLDKVLRAIRQFSDSEAMEVTVNMPMMHPNQIAVLDGIKERYERVVSLEAVKPELVSAK